MRIDAELEPNFSYHEGVFVPTSSNYSVKKKRGFWRSPSVFQKVYLTAIESVYYSTRVGCSMAYNMAVVNEVYPTAHGVLELNANAGNAQGIKIFMPKRIGEKISSRFHYQFCSQKSAMKENTESEIIQWYHIFFKKNYATTRECSK